MPPPKQSPSGAQGSQIVMKDLEDLLFDPHNPRLPHEEDGQSSGAAISWMLDNANIIELMNSIGEQGFFEGEPLVVVPSRVHRGKFEVVEGNRRLTAVMLLNDPSLANSKKKAVADSAAEAKHIPNRLPCLEFPKRDDVLHYLAFRHVTGIQPWKPLQKARYLLQLAQTVEFRKLTKVELRRRLAREIGTRPDYVGKLLAGLAVYNAVADNDFFSIPGLEEAEHWYSVLTTAVTSYKSIAGFLGLDGVTDDDAEKIKRANLKKLAEWLFRKNSEGVSRVAESRDLQKLARVVANKVALKKFEAGCSLDDADLLTDGPAEAFREAIQHAKSRLELARDIVHRLERIDDFDFAELKEIRQLAVMIEASGRTLNEQ